MGVVPEVEAPDGSGLATVVLGTEVCLCLVPEVDGVGDECGLLAEVELVELVLVVVVGVGAGAEEVAGGLALTSVLVGPKGCNLGTVVQLYWNSGYVSSSPVRNL